MSNDIFSTLSARAKAVCAAEAVVQAAARVHGEIRSTKDRVRADKNLSSAGQTAKLLEHLGKVAPALRTQRRTVDDARSNIESRRVSLKPKFGSVDSAILIAVAAKMASLRPAEQAALLLSADSPVDPVVAQAVLTLPPILSGVPDQLRGALAEKFTDKSALASIDAEAEAWGAADAAVRTLQITMQGEFPSAVAFDNWLEKAAPDDKHNTPDDRTSFDRQLEFLGRLSRGEVLRSGD